MRKIKNIKQMLMTEKGTSVVEIQRRLSVGYKEAKSLLQKLEVKSLTTTVGTFFVFCKGLKNWHTLARFEPPH